MSYQIEIKEGHDYSSYFWFRPVIITEGKDYWEDNVIELEEEISIEEEDVRDFLYYFLSKYFDKELPCNGMRDDGFGNKVDYFEWYLTFNFYTYETMRKMLLEIDEVATLLETDYNNPVLDDIKKGYYIFSMCSRDDPDYISHNNAAIEKHIHVVIDFYRRFTKRMRQMMDNNPNATIISVMGP